MTPTLWGRIQSRLFLMATIGLLVTLLFQWYFEIDDNQPLGILIYATFIGILWDILYIFIQQQRWDRDFPFAFQFLGGIVEGVFLYFLIVAGVLSGISTNLPLSLFIAHYGSVFLATFLMLLGPLQVLFPRWRFKGGEFGKW